jgi:predicted DNA-binding transcriptional regulator AlpA
MQRRAINCQSRHAARNNHPNERTFHCDTRLDRRAQADPLSCCASKRVGMGRTAVYELIKAGRFPRPVKVGGASAWIDGEITRWIGDLAAARDTQLSRSQ